MKKIIVLSLFLLIFINFFFAQNTFSVDLQKNSSITIHGTTNLLSFKLIQTGEKLTKRNFVISVSDSHNKIVLSQNEHSILVKDFTSENKMALRDFGLDPPVEMMGLIRVSEWINIDFNIICRISDYNPSGDYSTPNVPVSSHGRMSN